jgi:hypothetical protein
MGKRFRGKQHRHVDRKAGTVVVHAPSGESYSPGPLGVLSRDYPPKRERDHTISTINAVPEGARSADQWWMLGEYQVFNGLLDDDEAAINEGIAALTAGASLPAPGVACLMDLG